MADAILEKCKNIELLVLDFAPCSSNDGLIDESRTIASSVPLFGYLEKLTFLSLNFVDSEVKTETICELIKRCGMKLQIFHLRFYGHQSHKIVRAIGANLKNLKELKLSMYRMKDTMRGTPEDTYETKELQESVESILEGCQKLRSLDMDFTGWNDECNTLTSVIYDQISSKQQHLRYLYVHCHMDRPKPNLVKVIQALPYCKIVGYW